ncbi:MAG: sulfatase-like hydrolase/transferase [Bryocella sp.]
MHHLSRRTFLGHSSATAFAGALSPAFVGAAQAETEPVACPSGQRQNIICFMPDTLRADALGCYGNPIAKTPNFDKLAAMGTLFEDCHVQFPICGASRCSMLTGWPTSVRGHRSQMYFLRPDEPNLFRYMRQAGYDVL